MPFALPGLQVNADQALSVEIVAGAVSAVIVARGGFDWQVSEAELFIDGHLRPEPRVAVVCCGAGEPGVIPEFALAWNGVENPKTFARAHVVGAHIAFVV